MNARLKRNAWLSFTALLGSATTLLCCVLPAAMVALGAGAVLASLVSAVPQLIWMSQHKALVFGGAAALLVLTGVALLRARRVPCPADPELGRACRRIRTISAGLYALALIAFAVGAAFAFVLPRLNL